MRLSAHRGEDQYVLGMMDNFYGSEACYDCKYASIKRVSDLTIADAWMIDEILPQADDGIGTSRVLLYTPKAVELMNDLVPELEQWDVTKIDNLREIPHLQSRSNSMSHRKCFYMLNKICTVNDSVTFIRSIDALPAIFSRKWLKLKRLISKMV